MKRQDEDIEKVLKIGEERTEREEKTQKEMMQSIQSFHLTGKDDFDMYAFNGENFRNKNKATFLHLSSRSKRADEKIHNPYHAFQFIDLSEMTLLLEKEAQLSLESRRLQKVSVSDGNKHQHLKDLRHRIERGEEDAIDLGESYQREIGKVVCDDSLSHSVIYRRKIRR